MSLSITPLHPHIGAEIAGLDLSRPVDAATVDALWRAIDRHAVLVFHDQRLSDRQLHDFAVRFGDLEIGRSAARGGKRRLAIPQIGDISNLDEETTCAPATTGGGSTASATGGGTPMRRT
jgi:alpha-ketoglutarate-dependent 2,4-dichlorophenoxyacetate dioxygenase